MVFWRNSSRRNRRCFYCNQNSILLVDDRSKDWLCPLCDALNVLDNDGAIADDIPQRYQTDQGTPHKAAHSKKLELSTPFCSVCTSNQALLINTLANFLPAEDNPDFAVYERALPAYKASLQERYPPVCASCAPTIQARLDRNNYIAKSMALGNWLKGTKLSTRPSQERHLSKKILLTLVWAARGFLWLSSTFFMIGWLCVGILAPSIQRDATTLRSNQSFSISNLWEMMTFQLLSIEAVSNLHEFLQWWIPTSLLGTFWTFKSLPMIWQPTFNIQGKAEYARLQVLHQVLKGIVVYALPRLRMSVEVYMRLSAFFLFLSILHLVCSLNMLQLVDKPQINLRGTSSSFEDTYKENYVEFTGDLDDMPASHVEISKVMGDFPVTLFGVEEEEAEMAEPDSMDWQPQQDTAQGPSPSPFTMASTSATSSIPRMFPKPVFAQPREHYFSSNPAYKSPFLPLPLVEDDKYRLARQRFFAPERPTGLENLFSAAVTLDDEPLLVRSIKSVQRMPVMAARLLFITTLFMTVLLYLDMRSVMVLVGTSILSITTYLGLLQGKLLSLLLLWPIVYALSHGVAKVEKLSQQFAMTLLYCIALSLHLGIQGAVLYRVTRNAKAQARARAQRTKKRL